MTPDELQCMNERMERLERKLRADGIVRWSFALFSAWRRR
jgi:hypothetical protein